MTVHAVSRQRAASTHAMADAVEEAASLAPTPEAAAAARDEARRIADAIARLSPKLRDALLLAASGEHSYAAIGALLGVPVGTVKWRVSEARRLVARRLGIDDEG